MLMAFGSPRLCPTGRACASSLFRARGLNRAVAALMSWVRLEDFLEIDDMLRGFLRLLTLTLLGLGVAAPPALAQNAPVRIRGTIEKVEGDTYLVKARDGAEVKLKLAPNATVVALVPATAADIKQGSYIGVSGMPQADGSQKALEVHIFPESMRGVAMATAAGTCSPRAP